MTVNWRPAWIYASDFRVSPLVALASALPGLRVLYHEHDSPEQDVRGAFNRWCVRARALVGRRAEICVLPTRGRADAFAHATGRAREVRVVWNCPASEEVRARLRAPGRLRVLYHGVIVPPLVPLELVDALASLPSAVGLVIVGYSTVGSPGHLEAIRARARSLAIVDRMEIHQAMPRDQLLELARTCDIGLALMPLDRTDVNYVSMAGASNKAFDYLACGLPLLVSRLPEWEDLFVREGYALACDPRHPRSIAEALTWFAEHAEQAAEMGEHGRRRILDEWNYETQFAPVLALLET